MELKIFRTTVEKIYIGSLKSLSTLFDTCLDYVQVKFEQNHMVRNKRNFDFDRKPGFLKAIFDKELTPFWKTFVEMKQLLNAKLLISRLPSFIVPNITVVRHV